MIFVLHGENLSRSRTAILGLQEKLKMPAKTEVSILETPPGDLLDVCASFDIFGQPPFVVIDITDVGRRKVDKYIEVLEKIPAQAVLVILSGKRLSKRNAFIKGASKLQAKIILSDVLQKSNVFKFIDCVFAGNRKASYKELQKLLLDEEAVLKIFSMLLYGLRAITLVKLDSPGVAKLAPFVRNKAKRQAQKFSKKDLLTLFEDFYRADRDVKTGKLPFDILIPLVTEKVFSYVQ